MYTDDTDASRADFTEKTFKILLFFRAVREIHVLKRFDHGTSQRPRKETVIVSQR